MAIEASPVEAFDIPLAGRTEAHVRLGFGGGDLLLGQAPPGTLLSGTFEGGVVRRPRGDDVIDLEPFALGRRLGHWTPLHWNVAITTEIPVTLRLETGGNRSTLDLSALRIRRLELETGASETTLRRPAAGETAVRIACGLASVAVEVPPVIAARIRGRLVLGSTIVDQARFPLAADGLASTDYAKATDRVDIEVVGGLGSIKIR